MESMLLLLPLSLLVLVVIVAVGFWAIRSAQYDRLDSDGEIALFNETVDPETTLQTPREENFEIGPEPPR